MKNDDEDLEDSEDEDVDEEELEKEFETVFSDGEKVYFLEVNGSWWSNTFKSKESAKAVADRFRE